MELRHLKYFVAVAEELHFGRAAQRLHMAQPPLSQQIRQLEEELEVRLFERTSRKVSLTPEGELFLDETRKIFAGLHRAVSRVQSVSKGETGSLAVSFVGPGALSLLPEALRSFHENNPDIRLDLTAASTRDQLRMMRSGRMDVAFMHLPGHDVSEFNTRLFLREPYILAVPAGHELAGKKHTSITALEGEPMIFYPRHLQPPLFDSMIACFHKAGVSPDIVQESNTEQSSIALVAAGMGSAFVPASSQRNRRKGVEFLTIEEKLPSWEITMVWPDRSNGPILDRFMQTVDEYRRA